MGKRDRERINQIKQGIIKPFRNVAIKAIAYNGVKDELMKGETSDQVNRLSGLMDENVLPSEKLKKAIMKSAPKEMDNATKKYKKQGKEITVDLLVEEVERNEGGFRQLAENVGLTMDYFRTLAKERMSSKL